MPIVVGIRFRGTGKIYHFDAGEFKLESGNMVVVETSWGLETGEVATASTQIEENQLVAPLKSILRVAAEDDLKQARENAARVPEAIKACQQKADAHQLEMKVVDAMFSLDSSKVLFYFTADGRVDFRELVKDLASTFRMRIELRQIGVRDEAKMLGGLGPCGRPICCASFLDDFSPVSIRMAKEQNLSLNPTKISGLCSRLMCCLQYEQVNYEQIFKRMPKVGKEVITPDGRGTVVELAILREKVKARVLQKDGTYAVHEYDIDQVRRAFGASGEPLFEQEPPAPQETAREEKAAVQAAGKPAGGYRRRPRRGGEARPERAADAAQNSAQNDKN